MQTYEAELAYYRQKRAWMGRLGGILVQDCREDRRVGGHHTGEDICR